MGLISKIEAAIKLGVGVELIDYFSKKCPKPGGEIKLKVVSTEIGIMYDENDLVYFQHYLNQPWLLPKVGLRPAIPKPIKKTISK